MRKHPVFNSLPAVARQLRQCTALFPVGSQFLSQLSPWVTVSPSHCLIMSPGIHHGGYRTSQ